MSTSLTRPWPIRAVGLTTVAVFLVLVARFWHPVYGFTSFLQLDSSNDNVKIAAFRERPVFVYRDTGGYDGLYYAQIAYHPLLNSPELAPAMDSLAYRGRRILPPALAWILAAGNPDWIVHVYSLLNVAAWLGLAAILWRLLAVDSVRGWIPWAGVLFSAGALSCVRLALTDLVALTFIAAALLTAERGRRGWALGTVAAAGLARETSLLALTGLLERPWCSWRNLGRAAIGVAPLAGWIMYVNWRVGGSAGGLYNFTWPLSEFFGKWLALVGALHSEPERLLVWTTVLATLGLSVQALYFFIRRDPSDRWWRIGAAYTALMLCLGAPVWAGFPGAATRVLLPLTLAFNVVAARRQAALGWFVLGNLSVFSGLLTLGSVAHDHREMAAARERGTACVARAELGWYNVERNWRHCWAWSDTTSRIEFTTWSRRDEPVQAEFFLRSLTPRTVTIRDERGELWRGPVGPAKIKVTVTTRLVSGHGWLEFSTPEPAVHEAPERGSRALAFALYDLHLLVTEP